MKLPKLKLNKIKTFFKKLPRILGERALLTFLVLIFLTLILGSLIFYQYSILVEQRKVEVFEKPFQFKEKAYRKILEEWEIREKRFREADLKQYPNPFEVPSPATTPTPEELGE